MNKNILEFVKRDMLYIICLIICLAAILTLSMNWKTAMEERDEYWIDEGCRTYTNYMEQVQQYNDSMFLEVPYGELNENQD